MARVMRPVAVLAFVGLVTATAGLQVVSNAAPSSFELTPVEGADAYHHGLGFSHYDIRRLKILEPTLYHVEESYVERGRIDWEKMFVSGLEAVERKVPGFLFQRDVEARRVSLEIGEFRTALEVDRIGSPKHLQEELRRIAGLWVLHLEPSDIPTELPPSESGPGPFAEVEYALVNGILDTLDPHTMLLPPPDANEMDVENQGEFGGLGITVIERDGRLVVDWPNPGTPAETAGIHRHDVIHRIDGQSTINMGLDEAVRLLRGPVGSSVELQIMREGFEKPRPMTLERQIIKLNEVQGELLDGDVGLIAIHSFHKHVESELHDVLQRLNRASREGLRGVVLDLRGNPGGYLNQAVGVADAFLTDGEIVSTVNGNGRKQELERAHADDRTQAPYPVMVLVDASSASASEVVAGALRNNERAVILGERSFGKGSVQSLHKFYDDSKLKLTISKYLTPGERSIQAVGIPADIELVPVHVGRDEDDGALITRMFWREHVVREADLDHSLQRMSFDEDASAYRVHYLQQPTDDEHHYTLDLDDYQVQLARDLVLSAESSRRADILAAAAPLVAQYQRKGDEAITTALTDEGIDWSDGRAWRGENLPVRARLEVERGRLHTGARQEVRLHLTNTSEQPLYRVGALVQEHDVLEGHEFLFGRIDPGQTASSSIWVHLVDGYPSESAPLPLSIRDSGPAPIGTLDTELEVAGRPLPSFAWTWRVEAPEGAPASGQRVKLHLALENRGAGISSEAYARIRNRSGRDLDIVVGTLDPGELRTLDGVSCGQEDRVTGCQKRMRPGETWKGVFEVDLRNQPEDWAVELSIGDDEAYDHASVVGSGFYEHFEHTEVIRFGADEPVGPVRREPPSIRISRGPSVVETKDRATLSGVVEDDGGLRHVLVFGGGDKLFAQSAIGGLRSVPFTADATLEPGANALTVVAEDVEGFTTTRSVVTRRQDPERVTRATAPAGD